MAQEVVNDMTAWIAEHFPGGESGIVYCLTRKDAESLSGHLNVAGLSSSFYHADMDPVARQRVHHQWSKRKARSLVFSLVIHAINLCVCRCSPPHSCSGHLSTGDLFCRPCENHCGHNRFRDG